MGTIGELAGETWSVDGKAAGAKPVSSALPDGFHVLPWHEIAIDELLPHWRQLAGQASSPNPFLEDWFLLPGLRAFDPTGRVRIALLFEHGELVGLLPICRSNDYHDRTIPHWTAWSHANAFCGEPLIAPGRERAFWTALLDWVDAHAGTALFLHLADLPADGASLAALETLCTARGRACNVVGREDRAILNRGLSPDAHLAASVSKKRRKEFARLRRRLEEAGDLRFSREAGAAGLDRWIAEFLALEAGGWKGGEGSALSCDERTATLFHESLHGAVRSGRLERLAFHLDGRPIAMLAIFIAPPAAFGFKTAYDEEFARFSPGVLLQIENLALLQHPELAFCDSCAAPDHPMIDHLWRDRRGMAKLSIPLASTPGRTLGRLMTALEARRLETRA